MRYFLMILIMLSASLASPATAQTNTGGLGDILEDILGRTPDSDKRQDPGGHIENIPVQLNIQTPRELDGHMLIISAYAPNANMADARSQLIGQTHLLMTGLGNTLNLVVAVPEPVTRDLEHARLSANIRDRAGNIVLSSQASGYYSGVDPARLSVVDPAQAPTPFKGQTEPIRGRVSLKDGSRPLMRGSRLVVRILEQNLAGGPANSSQGNRIVAEKNIDLDGRDLPVNYTLDRPVRQSQSQVDYVLSADIIDWAGRRTHYLQKPLDRSHTDRNYNLVLAAGSEPETSLDGPRSIKSEARFNADRGLPSGAKLIAILINDQNPNQTLATQTVRLDGLSGYIAFELSLPDNFDTRNPTPLSLKVRIETASGTVFFEGTKPVATGFNAINLTATSQY